VRSGAILRLEPGVVVRVVDVDRAYPPALERRIDEIWQRLRAERPGELYDGSVATLESATPDEIRVGRAPFRHFAAQSADEGIREDLDLWCLGVSGVTTAADRLLFGRRAAVTHYRGHWELVPSGHLPVEGATGAQLDPITQLLDELHEEVGIPRERVVGTRALALVPDLAIRMSDLFFALELDHTPTELEAAIARPPCDEYDAIVALAAHEVADFVDRPHARVLDTTRAMLRALGGAL